KRRQPVQRVVVVDVRAPVGRGQRRAVRRRVIAVAVLEVVPRQECVLRARSDQASHIFIFPAAISSSFPQERAISSSPPFSTAFEKPAPTNSPKLPYLDEANTKSRTSARDGSSGSLVVIASPVDCFL